MIDFVFKEGLLDLAMPDKHPKAKSITPGQQECSVTLWVSDDQKTEVGVWECTPGRFTALDKTNNSEICHILSGVIEMTHTDGRVQRLTAGDMIVLPQGWKGDWHILETTRKLYMIVQV